MATRPSLRRLEKWDNFLSGDVLSVAVGNYKPKMREQLSNIFPELETLENEVKIILAEAGTPSMFNTFYLNFAREVYRYAKKFSGSQLLREVDIILNKWHQRSLDRDVLERIRNTVFTIAATSQN
ncbi:MAG: hypothetical protein ABIK10_06180 [candidate division WOR-3 bacterium]